MPCTVPCSATARISAGVYRPRSLSSRSNMRLASGSESLSITLRTKASANSGSTPDEAPANIDMVPVGAMVVTVALRGGCASCANTLCSQAGKGPRTAASAREAAQARSWMKPMTSSASFTPSSLAYDMPSSNSMSAQPITPRPILRLLSVMSRICSSGYTFASITLSRKCTAVSTTRPSRS